MPDVRESKPDFDPYYHWLGVPPDEQPANHYRLLGLQKYESDARVIENAADRQMNHVRSFQLSAHKSDCQRLLNELAAARLCLLSAEKKEAYDAGLKRTEVNTKANRQAQAAKSSGEDSVLTNGPLQLEGSADALSGIDLNSLLASGFPRHNQPTRAQSRRPIWKQPRGIAVISIAFITVFAFTFWLGSMPFESTDGPATTAAGGASGESKISGDVAENGKTSDDATTDVGKPGLQDPDKQDSEVDEHPLVAPSTLASDIRNLVSNALVIYNFEPGTYAREADAETYILQDLGPGDTWGRTAAEFTSEAGMAGQAMSFDGVSQAVIIPHLRALLGGGRKTLTISFWQKTTSPKLGMMFDCGTYASRCLSIVGLEDNHMALVVYGAELKPARLYSPNRWRHVAAVLNQTLAQLYIDGQAIDSWEIPGKGLDGTTLGSSSASIGGLAKSHLREERYFHGLIDEFVILPHAATSGEVEMLYEWSRSGNVLPTIPDAPLLEPDDPHGVPEN